MDDMRYHPQQSPRNDNSSSMNHFVSPTRNGRMQHQQQSPSAFSPDPRSNMPRRFTTDSGHVPTLSSMGTLQRVQADPAQDYKAMQQSQLIEKKKQEYERIKEQRLRFERQMKQLEMQQRQEALELARLEDQAGRMNVSSEPTTPPEYHNTNQSSTGFPSMFSRPNRYSASNLISPPGFHNRPARSGSQLASPPAGVMMNGFGFDNQHTAMPSRSVPTTRRNSDDEKDEAVRQDPSSHRSGNALNRYSMPVTRSRNEGYAVLDQANTTRFLFGDEDGGPLGHGHHPDESSFPTLVRRDDQFLSASSAALDLASSSSPAPEAHSSRGWNNIVSRHRPQQSLSSLNGNSLGLLGESATFGNRGSLRNSIDLKYATESANDAPGLMSPQHMASPPKLQSSFSANDVPTVKSTQGTMANANANNHAQQHFHNHNASIGRIPAGAVQTRTSHNRELSNDSTVNSNRDQANTYQSFQSALQANAPSFASIQTTMGPLASPMNTLAGGPVMNNFNNGYYPQNGYNHNMTPQGAYGNMNMLTAGFQQIGINGMGTAPQGMYGGQNLNGYQPAPYTPAAVPPQQQQQQQQQPQQQPLQQPQPRDSQARVIQSRRQQDNEAMSRYQNMPLESFQGQIYSLCKDQHGCRYLQKKLEERIPEQVHMIWAETNDHVTELMMDPFGNYLCQKLLEFCNDDERTRLIENASREMARIALDQHGTRALQKMIEHVTTPPQVHLITEALRNRVVELIQDLNGNHVIQKCLNKLAPADAQFIFDAVGQRCVEVGTHRHGCCVLQRCIDHADGNQKVWLIGKITENARRLVQDPFGNYVVQYIIDLNEPRFTEPVVAAFQCCICDFSCHKFSSNVIEKCLRCAKAPSRDLIVNELLTAGKMETLLKDAFANYVIQTALDYATPQGKHSLVEAVRPFLPQLRGTPHGRRIQVKVTQYDNQGGTTNSGQTTPADRTQGQIPLRQGHSRGMSNGGVTQLNGGQAGNLPNSSLGAGQHNVQNFPNGTQTSQQQPSGFLQQTQPNGQTQMNHVQPSQVNGQTQSFGQQAPPFQPQPSTGYANSQNVAVNGGQPPSNFNGTLNGASSDQPWV